MLLFLANVGNFLARIFRGIFSSISDCTFGGSGRAKSPGRRSQGRGRKGRPRSRNVGPNCPIAGSEIPSVCRDGDAWDDVEDEEMMEVRRRRKKSGKVPVLGCLIIMGSYLFGGAMLFALWENWPYLDAFYFCFVTLTTIGFGDFVPGASMLNHDTSSQKLVVCCVYVLVGLALIACCFNLMQEQVRWYAATLGRFLGFVEETKPEDIVIVTERVHLDA
jgi:Ion channel